MIFPNYSNLNDVSKTIDIKWSNKNIYDVRSKVLPKNPTNFLKKIRDALNNIINTNTNKGRSILQINGKENIL